jgi:hypothetical protein
VDNSRAIKIKLKIYSQQLNRLVEEKNGNLNDPEIIKLSQYIDKLLIKYIKESS